jgi:hypothetical protein
MIGFTKMDFGRRVGMTHFSFIGGLVGGVMLQSATVFGATSQGIDEKVDFARQILPILSDKCFVCHGPDTQKKDFLRLDSFEGATEDRGGYRAIDTEKPEEGEMLARLHDADDPMPPEDAEKQLSESERELLSLWLRQGGDYAKHWAFVPPVKVDPPTIEETIQNEIDGFVYSKLKSAEVGFAAAADKATLARRLSLVLTGLPPETEQLASFMADAAPDAYERLVEEMLSSPRYGEHQARYWLDAVRYGDTHGLHLDNRRGIYPYRDWVVKAFNENLPFDDFITWQLAGDLLPKPSLEQRLATGYVRMNPTTSEGGAIPLEFQAKNNFDRTETLGTVFLGMTMTCSRCHTHKYDPITQTEYYQLFAFFNSTTEKSMDGNSYEYGPVIKVPSEPSSWPAWEALLENRDRLLKRAARDSSAKQEDLVSYAETIEGWASSEWKKSKSVAVAAGVPDEDGWEDVKGLPGKARRKALPKLGESIYLSFKLEAPADQVLWLQFLGGVGSTVSLDETAVETNHPSGNEQQELLVPLQLSKGSHSVSLKVVGSSRSGDIEVRLKNPWAAVAKSKDWKDVSEADRLLLIADTQGPLAGTKLSKSAASIAQQLMAEAANLTTSLVAGDLEKRRETKILSRGEYNLPIGEALEPGVLNVMGALPKGAPKNRLGLAQWLTDRDQPVVSRVLINRVWQRIFGEGLVRSPEDFGLQGRYPSHPQLLDWLAVEWQDRGWDLKEMIRLMVTSRTFRQSSQWRDDVGDPENLLFARGPSHRLDAEVLRDIGLWAGGILDPHMGGEGVKPYQPSGLWMALAHPASNTKQYVRDSGRLLYRRSLYVYWKRTSPHPMMTLFDAPSRETSCVRRSRTNTPLQSLGLLNETQRIEMARMLGERLLREGTDDDTRVDLMFTLLASREPMPAERIACQSLLERMRGRYQTAPDDAKALLSTGEIERDTELDLAEHAAWTQVATAVLASDVAILVY